MKLLLFVAVFGGMLCIAPAAIWLGTGDWRAALEAAKGYWKIIGGMLVAAAVLGAVMWVASAVS